MSKQNIYSKRYEANIADRHFLCNQYDTVDPFGKYQLTCMDVWCNEALIIESLEVPETIPLDKQYIEGICTVANKLRNRDSALLNQAEAY